MVVEQTAVSPAVPGQCPPVDEDRPHQRDPRHLDAPAIAGPTLVPDGRQARELTRPRANRRVGGQARSDHQVRQHRRQAHSNRGGLGGIEDRGAAGRVLSPCAGQERGRHGRPATARKVAVPIWQMLTKKRRWPIRLRRVRQHARERRTEYALHSRGQPFFNPAFILSPYRCRPDGSSCSERQSYWRGT